MLWDEFIYETESRRSASSEGLAVVYGANDEDDTLLITSDFSPAVQASATTIADQRVRVQISAPVAQLGSAGEQSSELAKKHSSAAGAASASSSAHGVVKLTMSSGVPGAAAQAPHHKAREQAGRPISSRFREKPKLKRGQTMDSVFRIPLIPSSPLKHAQQHQQTPTAHLEDHDLLTIEDDEGSISSGRSVMSRPASLRSRSGSQKASLELQNAPGGPQQVAEHNKVKQPLSVQVNHNSELTGGGHDSSFEIEDTLDLQQQSSQTPNHKNSQPGKTPGQIVRQSSLSTLSSTITRTEQKRQRALWDLFQSECAFFFDHLLTLKNVYMEPLKKIQVEGFAMFADPDVLFGNLDELCCGVYDFCKEFLYIIMRTLKTRPEELNATDVLIKLYKKNPKIDHLRGVYHRYTLNYINALTYLDNLRRQVEFVEFEKWSSRDTRCKKLKLTDLLVAPVQHIMRVPIILKDIESHTENVRDRDEIRAILAVEEASVRELDDKMRWLKNFERMLEIQKNINWPSVLDMDPKLFIPEVSLIDKGRNNFFKP